VLAEILKNLTNLMESKEYSIPTLSALIIGYITTCGILWHIGYWSTFDFNYLEYANLSDLFKVTLYPFLSTIWVLLATLLFSGGLSGVITLSIMNYHRNRIAKGKIVSTTNEQGRPSSHLIYLIITLCIFVSGCLIMASPNGNLVLSTWLIGFAVSLLVYSQNILIQYFKTDIGRFLIVSVLIFYALFNFTNAKTKSFQISYRFKYNTIDEILTGDSSLNKLVLNKPFLGTTEKYTFVLTGKNKITVLDNSQIKGITISPLIVDSNYKAWLGR
jgi:hypothetical protein